MSQNPSANSTTAIPAPTAAPAMVPALTPPLSPFEGGCGAGVSEPPSLLLAIVVMAGTSEGVVSDACVADATKVEGSKDRESSSVLSSSRRESYVALSAAPPMSRSGFRAVLRQK